MIKIKQIIESKKKKNVIMLYLKYKYIWSSFLLVPCEKVNMTPVASSWEQEEVQGLLFSTAQLHK